jgi:POT family proton-dependent oligopeptide transporter
MNNLVSTNGHAKQPLKLYLICFVSLWERYAFYTMRGILVLYMTQKFLFSNSQSYSIFAVFSALLYLTPLFGGHLADKVLGAKRAIIIGGGCLALGYALLAVPGLEYFYLGLGAIIIGSGLFIPNIATMVSDLYKDNATLREGGFSIFYTSINIGALIPPLVAAIIVIKFGWNAAFIMAAVSMILSIITCIFSVKTEQQQELNLNHLRSLGLAVLLIAMAVFSAILVTHTFYADIIIFVFSGLFILYTVYKSFSYDVLQRKKLLACLLLIILSIVFSVLYQQAGMSLTIYTEFNVGRHLGQWYVPTIMFQSLNPLFIILLGPFMARLWMHLSKNRTNPSISIKFGAGTVFMGLGFIILTLAIVYTAHQGVINLWWIVASYFLQTVGEMLVSPIGLSMVSELSPVKMVGLMMGTWYFATSVADALAGFVANWTTTPSGSNEPLITSPVYYHTFALIGGISLIVGIFIIIISPFINTMIGKRSFDI